MNPQMIDLEPAPVEDKEGRVLDVLLERMTRILHGAVVKHPEVFTAMLEANDPAIRKVSIPSWSLLGVARGHEARFCFQKESRISQSRLNALRVIAWTSGAVPIAAHSALYICPETGYPRPSLKILIPQHETLRPKAYLRIVGFQMTGESLAKCEHKTIEVPYSRDWSESFVHLDPNLLPIDSPAISALDVDMDGSLSLALKEGEAA